MGIGFSLILFAAGAILAFAVDAEVAGLDIKAVGVILMVVGAIGLLFTLLFWSSFAPFGEAMPGRRRSTVYHDEPDVIVRERPVERVIREEPATRVVERERVVREVDDTRQH